MGTHLLITCPCGGSLDYTRDEDVATGPVREGFLRAHQGCLDRATTSSGLVTGRAQADAGKTDASPEADAPNTETGAGGG